MCVVKETLRDCLVWTIESCFLSSVITHLLVCTCASLISVLKSIDNCQSGEISFAVRDPNEWARVCQRDRGKLTWLVWIEATLPRRRRRNLKWHFAMTFQPWNDGWCCRTDRASSITCYKNSALETALPTGLVKDCITLVANLVNCVKAKVNCWQKNVNLIKESDEAEAAATALCFWYSFLALHTTMSTFFKTAKRRSWKGLGALATRHYKLQPHGF